MTAAKFGISVLLGGLIQLGAAGPAIAQTPAIVVHRHMSATPGTPSVNAYIVEGERALVVVDALLTDEDGRALRRRADELRKPVEAVLLTHGHPDHYGGLAGFLGERAVPVLALDAVDGVIRANDPEKGRRVRDAHGDVWPARRAFPSRTIPSGVPIELAGLTFTPFGFGPGEAPVDGYWSMSGASTALFIGDLAYSDYHPYLAGDERKAYSAEWLRHLDVVERRHPDIAILYPGHGAPGDRSMLGWTRDYLSAYRRAVTNAAAGRRELTGSQRRVVDERMRAFAPAADDAFLSMGMAPVALELSFEQSGGARRDQTSTETPR